MAAQCVTKWLVNLIQVIPEPRATLAVSLRVSLRGCECFPAGGDEWAVWAARREHSP